MNKKKNMKDILKCYLKSESSSLTTSFLNAVCLSTTRTKFVMVSLWTIGINFLLMMTKPFWKWLLCNGTAISGFSISKKTIGTVGMIHFPSLFLEYLYFERLRNISFLGIWPHFPWYSLSKQCLRNVVYWTNWEEFQTGVLIISTIDR